MRLLVLTNNPDRSSFRQRFKIHLKQLQGSGIECSVTRFPPDWPSRYPLLKSAAGYDAVYLHKKRLNFIEDWCLRRYCRKLIYDFDDAIMYNDAHPDHHSLARYLGFRRTIRRADVVIAGNEILGDHARRYSSNVRVLPTGLNVDEYTVRFNQKAENNMIRLGWIGSAATLAYLIGIRGSLEEIGRRHRNVVLRIIADRFLELKNMPVERCVWSPATQASDLAACHIGLAPLPDDRFTRGKCGFKILQYAATGIPFIASGVGVNSVFVGESEAGLIAEGEEEWISRLSALIGNDNLRSTLGRNGRRYAEKFDARILGPRLVSILKGAL